MAFNAAAVKATMRVKNQQARAKSWGNTFQSLPFVEPSQLVNGEYQFRIWPPDMTKNPLGFLYYRIHTLLDGEEVPHKFCCPRSTNWEPLPQSEAEVLNDDGTPVLDNEGSPMMTSIWMNRCWACETEAQLVDLGFESTDQLPGELGGWAKELFGKESTHFPVTFRGIEVATSELRWRNDPKTGELMPMMDKYTKKQITDYTYQPAMDSLTHTHKLDITKLLHCDLSLGESTLKKTLMSLIEETPDCSHPLVGRWFKLKKQSDGKGAGGYELHISPNVTPMGFEIPEKQYPNYATWGKGNPAKGNPGSRKTYAAVEAIGSDPLAWYAKELRALGVILSDDETPVGEFTCNFGSNRNDDDIPF